MRAAAATAAAAAAAVGACALSCRLQKSKVQKFSATCTTGAEAATATVLGAAARKATQAAFLQYLPGYRIQPLLLPTHRRVQADDAERARDHLGGGCPGHSSGTHA